MSRYNLLFKIHSIALGMGSFSILLSVNSRNSPMTFLISHVRERERERGNTLRLK
jgi:hypothetical protein